MCLLCSLKLLAAEQFKNSVFHLLNAWWDNRVFFPKLISFTCFVLFLELENLAVYCRASERGEEGWGVVLPEKVGQSSPKFFRGCYPIRHPIMMNFIEIDQTSLEIGVGRKKNFHTQIDTHTAS